MSRLPRSLGLLAVVIAVPLVIWYWPHVRDEFFVLMGNRAEAGGYYGWWSGIGGATQNFTLAGGALLVYRHRNCHVHRCWRIGRHQAGPYTVCRRHMPGGAPSAEDVASAHEKAAGTKS